MILTSTPCPKRSWLSPDHRDRGIRPKHGDDQGNREGNSGSAFRIAPLLFSSLPSGPEGQIEERQVVGDTWSRPIDVE